MLPYWKHSIEQIIVMTMRRDILFLRLSYWIGALVDFIVGIAMVFPDIFSFVEGLSSFSPGADYLFAMGMGASLMFGWTALLLWGDRKPVERKGILLLTIIPVMVGIYATRLYGLTTGFVNLGGSIISLIIPIFLAFLFLGSYFYSDRRE